MKPRLQWGKTEECETFWWQKLQLSLPLGISDVSGRKKSLRLALWNLSSKLFKEDQKQGDNVTRRQTPTLCPDIHKNANRQIISPFYTLLPATLKLLWTCIWWMLTSAVCVIVDICCLSSVSTETLFKPRFCLAISVIILKRKRNQRKSIRAFKNGIIPFKWLV